MRNGARMGNVEMKDHMILDGLWDVYNQQHMGMCAESVRRGLQDQPRRPGRIRARVHQPRDPRQKEGLFKAEIVPVPVPQKKGEPVMVADDEGPKNARPEKIAP
jgi:acetyl-CoA C-acetyltransferase